MAYMFPEKEDFTEIPFSEIRILELLKKLPDSFYVFHSVKWVKRSHKWKSTWKENDFLILNKELGGIVLEVKGGNIEYHGGVFYQTNMVTKETNILSPKTKNDPLSQAIDGIYHYRNLISEVLYGLERRYPIEAAVWFPMCDISEKISSFPLGYREIQGAVLDYNALNRGINGIYDILDFYNNYDKTHISDEEFKIILNLIASDFELIVVPSVKKAELDYTFLRLTKEQTGLLDYITEQKNATVQGVAGTGKTIVAKEAAMGFANIGRKVLFLCFNRFLCADLKRRYPHKNVSFYNINALVSSLRPGEDTSNSKNRCSVLYTIGYSEMDYDDVIIDEAQDFENQEILYFKELTDKRNGHMFVFYDKNQLVTTREVPEWINSSECKLVLSKNCRNTYEIATTSYNIIDIPQRLITSMANGEQPYLCFVDLDPIGKLSKLLSLFTGERYGYEYSDIVILSLLTEEKSLLKGIYSIGKYPLLRKKSNSAVFFTTARKFKGLESRVVIIIDIDETFFSDEDKKRVFYVACSRATQQLALFVCGDDQKIISIADSISHKSHFVPKAKIAMKTHSKILEI